MTRQSYTLTELGVPEGIIEEVHQRAERGFTPLKPSEDLLQRTIAVCQAEFERLPRPMTEPVPAFEPVLAFGAPWLDGISNSPAGSALLSLAGTIGTCSRRGNFDRQLAMAASALRPGQRPFIMLDVHGAIQPHSWDDNEQLRNLRRTCLDLSEVVPGVTGRPGLHVMVLNRDAASYSDDDVNCLRRMLREETSDVYMVSPRTLDVSGPTPLGEKVCVVGEGMMLQMAAGTQPGDVSISVTHEEDDVHVMGDAINSLLVSATAVKSNGVVCKQWSSHLDSACGMRTMISSFI